MKTLKCVKNRPLMAHVVCCCKNIKATIYYLTDTVDVAALIFIINTVIFLWGN